MLLAQLTHSMLQLLTTHLHNSQLHTAPYCSELHTGHTGDVLLLTTLN